MTSSKKQTTKKSHFKEYGKDYFKFFIVLCLMIYLFRKPIIYPFVLNIFGTEKIAGYVIDEKNYERRGHLTDEFTYSYEFKIDNIVYSDNSNIKGLKVGDPITIEFNKYFPFINRITNNNDNES